MSNFFGRIKERAWGKRTANDLLLLFFIVFKGLCTVIYAFGLGRLLNFSFSMLMSCLGVFCLPYTAAIMFYIGETDGPIDSLAYAGGLAVLIAFFFAMIAWVVVFFLTLFNRKAGNKTVIFFNILVAIDIVELFVSLFTGGGGDTEKIIGIVFNFLVLLAVDSRFFLKKQKEKPLTVNA